MFSKQAQRGEWWEIGAKLTDPETGEPVDVTGRSVAVVVRTGPGASDSEVEVEEATGLVVDGPSGTVSGGGRNAAVGSYFGTLTVGLAGDGPGWPVKERFRLTITDCP